MPRAERAAIHPTLPEVPVGLDKPLSKVLTSWRRFELRTPKIEHLGELSLAEAVQLANKAQRIVAEDLGAYDPADPQGSNLEHPLQWREVTIEGAEALQGLFGEKGSGPRYLAFRHGTQQANETEKDELREAVTRSGDDKQKTEAYKKFLGMFFPNNEIDETNEVSLIEAVGLGVMLRWAQLHSGKKLVLRSSEFYRAKQPAEVLAVVTGIKLQTDSRLNSLGYRQPKDPNELEEMLHDLPKGSIPLDRELINKWGALVPPIGALPGDPT
ncbi:MAG: hypothetical protein KGL95_12090, partial [Patescibacteria group bacterium]|nr:hypothetical protein [Patescibacteria group bacterium]